MTTKTRIRSIRPRSHVSSRIGAAKVPEQTLASEALRLVDWLKNQGDEAPQEAVYRAMKWSAKFAGLVSNFASQLGMIEARRGTFRVVEDGGLTAVKQPNELRT